MENSFSGRSDERSNTRLSLGLAVCGLFAALVTVGHRPGAGLAAATLLLAGVVTSARPREWSTESTVAAALSMTLVAMVVVIDAAWVLAFDVIFALGLGSYALVGGRTFPEVAGACTRFVERLPDGVALAFSAPAEAIVPQVGNRMRSHGRGLLFATILFVVFGGLLTTADPAFREIAASAITPDIGGWKVAERALAFFVVMTLGGAFIAAGNRYAGPLRTYARNGPSPSASTRRSDWLLPLAMLDLLFASFVAIQIAVLFGGRHHVLDTAGLSFAQYARQGFFQLVFVAALTLGVVAAVARWSAVRTRVDRVMLQVLLGILCTLTLVILVSALKRLNLYEETYGATRLRISVHATILWLGGIFAMLLVAGAAWRSRWLPRATLYFTAVGLIVFTLINPEGVIARENLERFEETGEVDAPYLTTLGADAAPVLAEFPEPTRSCLLEDVAETLEDDGSSWTSFNFSRRRAMEVVRSTSLETCSYIEREIGS